MLANLLRASAVAALIAWQSAPALAQVPGVRYQPARPTVSPYLNLLRPDNAILPDYYTFVRPQQQAETFRAQQSLTNRQQQSLLFQQQNEIDQVMNGPLKQRAAQVRSTGTSSGFMNYSHYYQAQRGRPAKGAPRR